MPDQQQQINYGAAPNDGQGDPLRDAFIKTDDNFDAVWNAGPVGSNITILNNTVSVVNTNGNLVLRPNGIGVIQANASIIPDSANIRDLGSADRRWRRIYFQTLNTVDYEVEGDLTVSGNLTIQGDTIQIGNLVTDARTLQLSNTAANAAQANGSGITVGSADDIATLLYNSSNDTWEINIGLSASGNITADYFIGNGSTLSGLPVPYTDTDVVDLLSSGNVITDITTSANVSAAYILGDGSQLTGLPEQYSNANVVNLLADFGSNNIVTTGNVEAERLQVQNGVGNAWVIYQDSIFAPSGGEWRSENDSLDDYITSAANGYINLQSLYDDGSIASELKLEHGVARLIVADAPFNEWNFSSNGNLTTPGGILPEANAVYSLGSESLQWADLWVANNTIYIGGVPLGVTGNVLTVNGEPVLSNDSNTAITTTGNITANYFIGDGSQLTGLPEQYGNANVATFLAAFGSNTVSTTGNITAGNMQAASYRNASGDPILGDYVFANNIIETNNGDGGIQLQIFGPDQADPPALIDKSWLFGNTGAFYSPGNVEAPKFVGNGLFNGTTSIEIPVANSNIYVGFGLVGSIEFNAEGVTALNLAATGNITGATANISGNVTAGNVLATTAHRWATGNATIALSSGSIVLTPDTSLNALAGLIVGGSGYLLAPNGSRNAVLNYSGGSGTMGIYTVNIYGNQATAITNGGSNGVGNIGANTSNRFNTVFATAGDFSGNVSAGNVSVTGNISGNTAGYAIGYRDIPQVSFTGNTTIATTDAGKHYYSTQSTDYTLTIANNTSQNFAVGSAISIVNQGTGNITVVQGSGVSLYLAGNATAGNRTISTFGMATVMKVATDTWFINGTGVS